MSRQRDWQLRQEAIGCCVSCGKALPFEGKRKLCPACLEKNRVRGAEYRARKRQ